MKNKLLLAIIIGTFLSVPAYAQLSPMPASKECMKENVTINISYNNLKGKNFDDIKKLFDEQTAKINEYAKQQKISKFDLTSKNYNVSASAATYDTSGKPETFNYSGSGSSSYTLDNSGTAFKFCEFLVSQKIQVSMSSNVYNQGNCTKPSPQITD